MTADAVATEGQAAQPTEFSHGLDGAGLPWTGMEPGSVAQIEMPVRLAMYCRAASDGRGRVLMRSGIASSRKPSAAKVPPHGSQFCENSVRA